MDDDPSQNQRHEEIGRYEVKHIKSNARVIRINNIDKYFSPKRLFIATWLDERLNSRIESKIGTEDESDDNPSRNMNGH